MLIPAALTDLAACVTALTAQQMPPRDALQTEACGNGPQNFDEIAAAERANIDAHRKQTVISLTHILSAANLVLVALKNDILNGSIKKQSGYVENLLEHIGQLEQTLTTNRENVRRSARLIAQHVPLNKKRLFDSANQYSNMCELNLSAIKGVRDEIKALLAANKDASHQGIVFRAVGAYASAIKTVTGKSLDAKNALADGFYESVPWFEVPVSHEQRQDRKYKIETENAIHDAVADADEDLVGLIGIIWVTGQEISKAH